MSLVSFIVVFLIVWMILFFVTLPIGINIPKNHNKGFANSAPEKTNLKKKVIVSFLISFIPSCIIYWIVEKELFHYFFDNIYV